MEKAKVRVYIQNLKYYNEGIEVGKWFDLPIDDIVEEIEHYVGEDEFSIADCDSPFEIKVYENLRELNEVAKEITKHDATIVEAICNLGVGRSELINILREKRYEIIYGVSLYHELRDELNEIYGLNLNVADYKADGWFIENGIAIKAW